MSADTQLIHQIDTPYSVTPYSVTGDQFREVMGNYPTGVVIVTAIADDGERLGMVLGSFTSVSLDPPLVGFLPMKDSKTFARLQTATSICINILASDQESACRVFASPVPDRWERVGWRPSPSGAPILNGVVGWVDCEYVSVTDAGDHWFVLARVTALDAERDCLPLLFFQRGYGRFSPVSLVAAPGRDLIEAVRVAELAREEIEQLATEFGVECSVVAPVANEAVFVATANASDGAARVRLGMRVPFAPPLGTLLVGSPGAPSEEEWIARLGRVDDEVKASARTQLHRAQERGWSISFMGGRSLEHIDELVDHYSNQSRTVNQERRFLMTLAEVTELHEPEEILPDGRHDVLNITAPVRRANGDVQIVLRLGGLPQGVTGEEVTQWRDALLAAAVRVEHKLDATATPG